MPSSEPSVLGVEGARLKHRTQAGWGYYRSKAAVVPRKPQHLTSGEKEVPGVRELTVSEGKQISHKEWLKENHMGAGVHAAEVWC